MAPLEPGFGDRRGHLENPTSDRGKLEQTTLSLASRPWQRESHATAVNPTQLASLILSTMVTSECCRSDTNVARGVRILSKKQSSYSSSPEAVCKTGEGQTPANKAFRRRVTRLDINKPPG
jgi:hypothetical protein